MNSQKIPFSTLVAAFAALALLPAAPLAAQGAPGAADQAPQALSQPKPDYAFQLRRDDIEGRVTVSFTVTPQGDVTDAAIVASTQRRLEKPALSAIRTWKFRPATKGGVPVSSRVIEAVSFTLPEKLG